ncbi:eukaryotic peptide chain release factor GTP-binding subunit ERF3A isoform X2 [Glycine max]|uniref:eukaryotic peptide chain release factor GTP-binding subunit ERF3A isoform X2 n=1 Tax=Glycine max TaxID=3847 RepID=UPI001B354915|nr:eukaryotic peptide chain release factor GTP-binding subunit ERF3A isoform X2 [Glycine max]
MDIEEDIRSLQLDSAEDNNGVVNAEDGRPEEVEKSDKMDEDPKQDVEAEPKAVEAEPKVKDKEVPSVQDEEDEPEMTKRHLNVVFIGHVDAGKSTTGGQILFLSGQVDERTIQKYEKEAKDKSRESWYMAYIMDTNEEERVKGKTVEVGRAHFETETTRFTILDAPGHKSYVPNMISGASQADIGVLVISARKGEFETGYERGGQTREHVQLAKTLGVSKLLVVVNKMDEPTVQWSKERYDEIESKMVPFLKQSGYNVKKDVLFLPISGLMGANMKTRVDKSVCPWWNGPCLFEALDAIEVPLRDPNGPFRYCISDHLGPLLRSFIICLLCLKFNFFAKIEGSDLCRMPIIDKFKDMGTVVMGKVESGSVREGDSLLVMPNKDPVKVVAIFIDEDRVKRAGPGENLRIRLSGVEEEDILSGFVLSSVANPIPAVTEFVAQLVILELLDNAIFTAGYKAVLHIHSVVEECEIVELLQQIDTKTKKPMKKKVLFVKNGAVVVCRVQVNNSICIEKFSDFPQLGRFTLRTEGKTVAVGKVTGL